MSQKKKPRSGSEHMKDEVFAKLKKDFPTVATVTIEYFGGSDSFSEFSSVQLATLDGKTPKSLPKGWRKLVLNTTSAYMFSLFDHAGVSFVGCGCDGSFVFDLLKGSVTLTNYSDEQSFGGLSLADFMSFDEDNDASLEDRDTSSVYVTDRHNILYRRGGESDRTIQGQTFFIAGRLSLVSTKEAKVLLQGAGAAVHSRPIPPGLTYYVAGSNPGTSLKDAEERGIRVITEVEMLEMVGLHLQPGESGAGDEGADEGADDGADDGNDAGFERVLNVLEVF